MGRLFDEQVFINDARYMHCSGNKTRTFIKDDKLCRQYHIDLGEVRHLQLLLPGQLLKVLLQSLHRTAVNNPGVLKVMQEIRQKYYIPSIALYVRIWVRECEVSIQDKRISNKRITPELFHISEWDFRPEDLMQMELLTKLLPSGGYENIITAIDVFLRYASAYSNSSATSVNTAKVIIETWQDTPFYLYSLLQTTEAFSSPRLYTKQLNTKQKFETCLNKTCTNHLNPRKRPCLNQDSLKMASGDNTKQRHKFLPIAVLNYKTTYQSSIDCERSRVFHDRVLHNLYHKLGLRFNSNVSPSTEFADELLRRTRIL